ncbi:tetratricopeptide-like helical domain-containing protein [Tanacetum coccineum]
MYNTVIIALCDNPDKTMMDDALKLYQEMVSQPDVVTYNSLVSGLCKIRRWTKAYFLLKEMLDIHVVSPDVETFNILINTICCESRLHVAAHGEMDKARSLVNYMVSNHHLAPDTATYTSLLNGYCNDYDKMDDAMLIYHEMNEKGLINDAKRLFLEMEENHCWPTTDTYNYLLRVYLRNKCYDDVKVLLYKMKRQKHYLRKVTLSMLRASVAAGSLDATLLNLIKKLA